MTVYKKMENWGEQHHSPWMDVLRIFLGLTLMFKGFIFIMDTASLISLLKAFNFGGNSILFAHVIATMHLLTGFLITIGLATRICCLVQIPIMLGAIFFVNINAGGTRVGELLLSIFILLLLIFFFIKGSGKFSAYYYLINSKRSRLTDESAGDYPGGSSAAPLDKEANIL